MRALQLLAGLIATVELVLGVLESTDLALGDKYSVEVTDGIQYSLVVKNSDNEVAVDNFAFLTGDANDTTRAVGNDTTETTVKARMISDTAVQVQIQTKSKYTGATFSGKQSTKHDGVWGYPFNESLTNEDLHFDLKGLQKNKGVQYSSARAPFYMASDGYAVYTDTMAMGSYDFANDKSVRFIFNSTQLTYYIIMPKEKSDMKSLITQYAGLSDTTALWSPKAYGPMFWHNDWERASGWPTGVENSEEFVRDTVDQLFRNEIRASTIMVDRPYGTGNEGWGNWDFDPTYWPDPAALIANTSKYGLDFQVWVANRAVPGSELYEKADDNGWLFKEMATETDPAVALNLSIAEAYDYWKEGMSYFTDAGVRGYKIDRADEDEMPSWEQNVQSYLYHRLLYEGQATAWGKPQENKTTGFYNFARSVNDRSRRFTGVWNGDPDSTEDGLLYSIRSGVRAGLLGFPMWGSDCGGYTRKIGQVLPKEDLWARWAWFSAFSPVYEVMLYVDSVPWYDYSPQLVDVLRKTADIHHKLIPFIQSYMFKSTFDGLPIIRALFLEAPEDTATWDADESYFFGRELLIAPIVRESGSKTVYFPRGSKYLEYFNKTQVIDGGSTVTVTRDVYSTPVYVREGSIITRGDIYQFNNLWDQDWYPWLDIDVYPSFAIPTNVFEYYDEGHGTKVDILLETTKTSKKICVTYGPLGQSRGRLRFFVKGGQQSFEIKQQGATECLQDYDTLFE